MVALLAGQDLVIVLLIILVLFGSSQLPKLARSVGEASREFKKGHEDAISPPTQASSPSPDEDKVTMTRTDLEALLAERGGLGARPDEKVTMSRAELEALLAEREAQARKDAPPAS